MLPEQTTQLDHKQHRSARRDDAPDEDLTPEQRADMTDEVKQAQAAT
jgi:hypothetical protein